MTKIHHVSSIVKHPQENLDFYTNVMKLKLLKNTLNHEDKAIYHLYYGNDSNSALSTFFPMPDSEEGTPGDGFVGFVRYAIPPNSLNEWKQHLDHYHIKYFTYQRFNETYLAFSDPHGIDLELVERDDAQEITLHSATLFSKIPEATVAMFKELFDYQIVNQDEEILRLESSDGHIDIRKKIQSDGKKGHATVHHIAFSVQDIELWQKKIKAYGLFTSKIIDRNYFKSFYFVEPGGITIELATEGPGLSIDDSTDFIIPPHFMEYKDEIMDTIMPLFNQELDELKSYSYRNKQEYDFITKRNEIKQKLKETSNKDERAKLIEAYRNVR